MGELKIDEATRTKWCQHWHRAALTALETNLKDEATGLYSHGDTITLADICLASQAAGAKFFNVDTAPFPAFTRITTALAQIDAFARAHNLVVMYPQGIDKHWNDGRVIGHESMADDIGFMKAMLAEVAAQGVIDPKRVYAAGISNGGFMVQHMACVMPDALAGIASTTPFRSTQADLD